MYRNYEEGVLPEIIILSAASKGWLKTLIQENLMNVVHYIGFDIHKKSISYCIKTVSGEGMGRETAAVVAWRHGSNRFSARGSTTC